MRHNILVTRKLIEIWVQTSRSWSEILDPTSFLQMNTILGLLTSATRATATRCCRRSTSAGRSASACWSTRPRTSAPRRRCSPAWPTSSTASPRRRRRSAPSRPRSSSRGCARRKAEEFDNYMQQDAHEFLNFLINHINEIILAERHQSTCKPKPSNGDSRLPRPEPTWVHEIFQGILTSETRCLNCETVSSKDEDFFDLQVDVDQNTSITHCLRCFSNTETLCGDNKFKCDHCCSYQEAQKRMRVKKLPMILALHLKRFKYMEQYNRHIKVSHRVVFPLELRLFNTSDDAVNPDRMYDLVAVVIHCGSGPNRGHYISIVKSHGFWLLFDDDMVDKIDASTIEDFYGLTSDIQKSSETGYILFYQSRDCL
ncbi:ubiquitin carboxyl-terminal hydrolase 46 isoform X4 [Bacillus rossius redtenbacheri]|uniref:ubiquitin carboxyl-terminal hydrolase 46 isoform X4 n=1 Tax=Bacillus rossius redtenbacheri TaxID=93214 RepID=UPI002FDE6564